MPASRKPTPVLASSVTLEQRIALSNRSSAPTSADTVIAFGRPVPAHAMPGHKANYSRASRIPAPPLHPMLSRTGVTV